MYWIQKKLLTNDKSLAKLILSQCILQNLKHPNSTKVD